MFFAAPDSNPADEERREDRDAEKSPRSQHQPRAPEKQARSTSSSPASRAKGIAPLPPLPYVQAEALPYERFLGADPLQNLFVRVALAGSLRNVDFQHMMKRLRT